MGEPKDLLVIKKARSVTQEGHPAEPKHESEKIVGELLALLVNELLAGVGTAKVSYQSLGEVTEYKITAPVDERGRIVGQEGRTIRALRTVIFATARVRGFKASLCEV
ncbi:KH domain-containing protein [Bdellovibrio svalbardensis]|uniref:KH domain-containing protein n=1 Tax=Bdellovibrio svalbardensis TaxID=2972972 RepID=A0ABT6DGD4_9BACT|nr:KH domain-containing protein [Bdellovibrio svalbardensis]MDG0815902.1 KH domain-containing protein [Bdellovibrio svalbardensis]